MTKMQDLTGKRFERLVVLRLSHRDKWGKLVWICRCDCGVEIGVRRSDLYRGDTKSCGCLSRNRTASRNVKSATHGHTRGPRDRKLPRVYACWTAMKARCTNPRHPAFKNYGGRGITVCERWLNSFENFLVDMGEPPPGMSIDRIDNDGPYAPGNCRWATWSEQQLNRRSHRLPKGDDIPASQ